MTWKEIRKLNVGSSVMHKLYCMLCDFLADCTREECAEYRDSIVEIKTLIHYRMNNP